MKLSHVKNSQFLRNVIKVASGTAGAQLVTLVFIPVITRLFSPEDYGLLGTFTALLTIVLPVAALTYPIAIVLPKENRQVVDIASLSFAIALVIFVILTSVLALFKDPLLIMLGVNSLGGLVFLIPAAMLFSAFHQTNQQWLIRNSRYGFIGKASIIQALIVNITKTLAGLVMPTGGSLIIITAVGHLIHGLIFVKGLSGELAAAFKQMINPSAYLDILRVAKKYADFPKFRAPQTMIHALSQGVPILMLGTYFGVSSVGFYAMSMSVISAPVGVIGKSINDVFYPKATRLFNEGKPIDVLLIKSSLMLLVLGLPPLALLFFWGEALFGWLFGIEWRTAGAYAAWMSLWMLCFLVTRPVISTIPVLGIQKWFLKNEILNLVLRVAIFYLACTTLSNPLDVVAAFSILNMLIYGYIYFFVYRACGRVKGDA